jgi:hypothetical protein
MPENPWQQQFQKLLARASEEFKRTSDDLKVEAQRLLGEVRDPANQRKVKEGLRDIGAWAKKTADQAAEAMESAVKKAEVTWKGAAEEKTPVNATPAPKAAPKSTAPKTASKPAPAKSAAAPAKKTVGKKKAPAATAPAKPSATPAGKASAKSIGKKKPKAS